MATSAVTSRMKAVSSCQQDVEELISIFRALNAKGFWREREIFEISGGVGPRADDQTYEMCRTTIGNTLGVWTQVNDFPAWPYGLVQIQFASSEGDFEDLADLMQLLIKAAQLALRSPQAARGYLVGCAATTRHPFPRGLGRRCGARGNARALLLSQGVRPVPPTCPGA
jgi:hypothetical protein